MPLYYKDASGVHPIELGDSPSVSVDTETSASRAEILPSGNDFTVPAYTPGSGGLLVFVDGLLCVKGQQYEEKTETTIAFTFDLQTDTEVTAISISNGD